MAHRQWRVEVQFARSLPRSGFFIALKGKAHANRHRP
jgi:hypothetical protein